MKAKRVIISTHNANLGDLVCGLSNQYRIAEKDNMYLVLFSFGKRTNLLKGLSRLFAKPSKGRIEIFCSLTERDYTQQLGSIYSQLLGAEITNMYPKPITLDKNSYSKFNLSKLKTDVEVPSVPYVTWQFDALTLGRSEYRQFSEEEKQAIKDKYKDYQIVPVEGMHEYSDGLDRAVKLISGAEMHIGLDSGMAHVATALRKHIHLYNTNKQRRDMLFNKKMYGIGTKWQNATVFEVDEI